MLRGGEAGEWECTGGVVAGCAEGAGIVCALFGCDADFGCALCFAAFGFAGRCGTTAAKAVAVGGSAMEGVSRRRLAVDGDRPELDRCGRHGDRRGRADSDQEQACLSSGSLHDTVLAVALRLVERFVGGSRKILDAIEREGRTQRRSSPSRTSAHRPARRSRARRRARAAGLRPRLHPGRPSRAGGRELLAAETGRYVDLAQSLPQDLGKGAQHLVSRLVAVLIVDELEIVEIRSDERRQDGPNASGAWPRPPAGRGSGGGSRDR